MQTNIIDDYRCGKILIFYNFNNISDIIYIPGIGKLFCINLQTLLGKLKLYICNNMISEVHIFPVRFVKNLTLMTYILFFHLQN